LPKTTTGSNGKGIKHIAPSRTIVTINVIEAIRCISTSVNAVKNDAELTQSSWRCDAPNILTSGSVYSCGNRKRIIIAERTGVVPRAENGTIVRNGGRIGPHAGSVIHKCRPQFSEDPNDSSLRRAHGSEKLDRGVHVLLTYFRVGIKRPVTALHHITHHNAITAWVDAGRHGTSW
jgi:hypothetical protein